MSVPRFGIAVLILACVLLPSGCGGSGSSSSASGKVPTATMPAVLPEPLIIEGTPGLPPPPSSGDTYTVQPGDYPYLIAERLGVDVDDLIRLNDLDPTGLEVGQVLKIPGERSTPAIEATPEPRETPEEPATTAQPRTPTPRSGSGTTYTVQSGDNASDIAARFGTTVEELAAANNTTVEDLRSLEIGDVLVIPAASDTPTPEG